MDTVEYCDGKIFIGKGGIAGCWYMSWNGLWGRQAEDTTDSGWGTDHTWFESILKVPNESVENIVRLWNTERWCLWGSHIKVLHCGYKHKTDI
jgi:hypothetical protein